MALWAKPENLLDQSRQKKVAILTFVLFVFVGAGFLYLGNMLRATEPLLRETAKLAENFFVPLPELVPTYFILYLISILPDFSLLLFASGFIFIAIGVSSFKWVPASMRWEAAQRTETIFYILAVIYILNLFFVPLLSFINVFAMFALVLSKRKNLSKNKQKIFLTILIVLLLFPVIIFFLK